MARLLEICSKGLEVSISYYIIVPEPTFHYTGCLMGIPTMGYNKPYNKAYYNILYNLNNKVSDVHLRSWQGEASEALCSAFLLPVNVASWPIFQAKHNKKRYNNEPMVMASQPTPP